MSMLVAIFCNDKWGFYAFGGLFGTAQGVYLSVGSIIWAELFGHEHLGAIQGFANGAFLLGCGLGPIVFSVNKKLSNGYDTTIWILLGLTMLGNIALYFTQRGMEPVPVHPAFAVRASLVTP